MVERHLSKGTPVGNFRLLQSRSQPEQNGAGEIHFTVDIVVRNQPSKPGVG
jgi:hypothetical protein